MAGRSEGHHRAKGVIVWRVNLASPPHAVHRMLATDAGRARFWAIEAAQRDGHIHFGFPDGTTWEAEVVEDRAPHRFALTYLGGGVASFDLQEDGHGGTDLTLTQEGVAAQEYDDNLAGWVAVLLALKAAVDHKVDLRNHDPGRSWGKGFVDP